MATLNQFQQYSQAENSVTNNVLLMFSQLYEINPKYYEEYISSLIDENELYQVIPSFLQQYNNQGNGFIDGHISLKSSTIIIETKLQGLEWVDKLLKYTASFKRDDLKLLFHLSQSKYGLSEISSIQMRLEASENGKNGKFFSITYEELTFQLKSIHQKYIYEPALQKLFSHFESYCQNMRLLPAHKNIMRAMACGQSFNLNVKYQFYFDLSSRGYSPFNYLGIYKDKAVRYIGLVENVIEADYDANIRELKILSSSEQVTQAQIDRLVSAIEEAWNDDWYIDKNHRFFLLREFYETYFQKTSPGGIFRVRYFNLKDELDKVPDSVKEIADELRNHSWE